MNRSFIVAVVALSGMAISARAQNALGDGRGMQKNTNRFDTSLGPVNKGFDVQGARMRDAIVFGRAPGGLTTRASSLPDSSQFMGRLGTDTLYNFRRDSYFSGLAGQGIRSTDALQYQFAMTTGGAVRKPGLLEGTLDVGRFGGASGASVTENAGITRPLVRDYATAWRTDDAQTGGALRSTSSFVTSSMLRPAIVGERLDAQGVARSVAASPLLGLQTLDRDVSSPLNMSASPNRSASPDSASKVDPRSAAPGGPEAVPNAAQPDTSTTSTDEQIMRLSAHARTREERTGTQRDGTTNNAPGTQGRPETTPGNAPDDKGKQGDMSTDKDGKVSAAPQWMQDIENLRKTLTKPEAVAKSSGSAPGAPSVPGMPKAPPGMRFDESGKIVPLVDSGTMDLIRESGASGARFIKPYKDDRDPFVTEMQQGEKLFARSQFFQAEEKFARALSMKPSDVSAFTARTHAQLAGGMYASAATNLRELLTNHPEVASIRYARDLLPNEERRNLLAKDLDERMTTNPRMLGATGLKTIRDAGLLRAYLGFQTGDRNAVERGISMMLTSFEGRDEPTLNEQSLAVFLRGVWLGPAADAKPDESKAAAKPAEVKAAEPAK
ncbi:MAG: tetratricopeptide repeat protein [Phycisphaerales bacterium]